MATHAGRVRRDVWQAAGASDLWIYHRAAHTIGTCRMGIDPTDFVVDPVGRGHDVPNLFVVDHSVIPSPLALNPSLTIMALALRAADRSLDHVRRAT